VTAGTAPRVGELAEHELAAIAEVISRAGAVVVGPLSSEVISGGRSNLTYVLTDGAVSWVMRMPPRVGRTPSAHDVAREYRVTAALRGTGVPVPRAIALCEDESVIGGPFAVAEFVHGRTVQTRDELDGLDDTAVAAVGRSLVETLAALHRVDHLAVGLKTFGRPDAYAERQLRRWSSQWALVGATVLRPLAAALSSRLAASIPVQRSTGIVHGDYRIDNTILELDQAAGPRVAAVVDWELSTIGDPVADVAMMCVYRNAVFDLIVGAPSAWTSPRLSNPAALAEMYEVAGGVTLVDWDFHLALACFKIAVIAAGIDHRARAGAAAGPGFDTAGEAVATYLELGLESLDGRS
jgi:aminoglycoside phosphotransferase (APT) family kinase protein